MKHGHILLLTLSFAGCVAGPEDVAKKESVKDTQVAQSEDPEIVQVSSEAGDDFISTPSGLRYRMLEEGTGKKPGPLSTVVCHYKGWLDNGKEFDSSYKRGEPTSFPLNGVIPAWTEGLQLVKEGGKIELEVPSKLGYGKDGMPGAIPPNARLHFIVELVSVK